MIREEWPEHEVTVILNAYHNSLEEIEGCAAGLRSGAARNGQIGKIQPTHSFFVF
jgi:hypothetical protein